MISIVISSISSGHLLDLTTNVENTIGVPFEIIAIDNSNGKRGLCEVYNQGIQQAQYPYICLMHEDIELKTNNWGQNVIKHFENDPQLGLIGIAGSQFKSSVFSGWSAYWWPHRVDYANLIQAYKFKDSPPSTYYQNPDDDKITPVCVLDGVWLCTRNEIANTIGFDQHNFKGFHCYDIDFSLSVSQHFKVAVIYDVLLVHLSEGKFETDWAESTMILQKKWQDYLPYSLAGFSKEELKIIEEKCFLEVLPDLIKWNFRFSEILKVLKYSYVARSGFFSYSKWIFLIFKIYYLKKNIRKSG